MSGVGTGTALAIGAGVSGAASIGGSLLSSGAQTDAANSANATQIAEFNAMQQDLSPYMNLGNQASSTLSSNLNSLTAPVTMDQATLEKTPGYQFNLNQGLESVQNSAAARGLGSSGAALKGASTYATGLADSTYQNQFNNAVTNQSNTFNRLMGVTSLGESAAAGVGNAGITTGQSVANNTIGAGNAQAAGYNTAASSIGSSANNAVLANLLFGSGKTTNPVSGAVS